MTATYDQTATSLVSTAEVAAGAISVSSELAVGGKFSVTLFIDYGPSETGARAGRGAVFTIEVSRNGTGNGKWSPLIRFEGAIAAPQSGTLDGTEAVGDTVMNDTEVTSSLSVLDQVVFVNSTKANSCWGEVVDLTASTSFTIRDGLEIGQTSSTVWFNQAARWVQTIPTHSIDRIRVTCNNNAGSTNKKLVWRVNAITADSITDV